MSRAFLRFSGDAAFISHRRTAKRTEEKSFTAFIGASSDARTYFAAVASKRLGGAVERNRARRRLRAAFGAAIKGIKRPRRVMLYAKNGVLGEDFKTLVESVNRVLT